MLNITTNLNPFHTKMICGMFIVIIFLEDIDESPVQPTGLDFGLCSFSEYDLYS